MIESISRLLFSIWKKNRFSGIFRYWRFVGVCLKETSKRTFLGKKSICHRKNFFDLSWGFPEVSDLKLSFFQEILEVLSIFFFFLRSLFPNWGLLKLSRGFLYQLIVSIEFFSITVEVVLRFVTSTCSFVGKCTMFLKIILVRVKIFCQSCGTSEFSYLKFT